MGCKACCRGEQRERPNGSTRAPFLASQRLQAVGLRRQTVEGRCPLGCPRRRQCPEPHAASPRPRRSGRCFEARRGRGRGGAVVVARPTELVERRIRRDSRPRYAAKPNRLRPCHRVCSRGSSSRLPSRRAGSRRFSNRRSGGSGPSGCRSTRSLPREKVIHQCSTSLAPRFAKVRCPSNTTSLSQPRRAGVAPRLRPASRRCGHDPASASPATGSPPPVRFVQPLPLGPSPARGLGERAACASPSRVIGDC